jgi:hypothetical protein
MDDLIEKSKIGCKVTPNSLLRLSAQELNVILSTRPVTSRL